MNLRPYQQQALEAIESQFAEGAKSTLCVMATGLGKTVLFTHIAHRNPKRTLIIAHREELIGQAAEKVLSITGQQPDIEMADRHADLHMFRRSQIVVASKDSLHESRLSRFDPAEFGLVITDECFPAGTMIDGRPIESVRVGDTVATFNFDTQRLENGRVLRLFKSVCRSLVRVRLKDGTSIPCTPGHPFFTQRGYVPAARLLPNDTVFVQCEVPRLSGGVSRKEPTGKREIASSVSGVLLEGVQGQVVEGERSHDEGTPLQRMRRASHGERAEPVGSCAVRASVLLGCVQGENHSHHPQRDGGENQSCSRFAADDAAQPDEEPVLAGKDDALHEGQDLPRAWRERSAHNAATCLGSGPQSSHRGGDSNEARARSIPFAAGLLQGGRGRPGNEAGNRSGREDTPAQEVAVSGSPQDRNLDGVGVDGVEILEPGSDGRFGGLCPDGFVYNIEVEGTHNYFADGVLVHNCHHATAESYQSIYRYFKGVPHLGVTATPDRADEQALGQVFETVAFDYDIINGIDDGWLCPIRQTCVEVHGLDYSHVRTTAGDLNARDLADVMNNEETLQQIVSATIKEARWKKALVFAPPGYKRDGDDQCRVSERMVEIFNRHRPDSARLVSAMTPKDDRRLILEDFRAGRFQYLVNVGVFTEGFDDPTIDLIVLARATKSRSLYAQMVGRGTRPLPATVDGIASAEDRVRAIGQSAKPWIEILDFEGNAGRHKLMHVADILGGNTSEEARLVAESKIKSGRKDVDVRAAIREAEEELAKQREERRRAARSVIVGAASYSKHEVSPFDVLDIAPPAIRGWDVSKPPSEKQVALLVKFGVKPPHTAREASALIGQLMQRRQAGMCSYKQARLLAARGLDTTVSFERASELINEIASREGWKKREVAA